MLASIYSKEISTCRRNLIKRMTTLYGEDSIITKDFVKLCHTWTAGEQWDICLTALVEAHEDDPQTDFV